MNVDRSVKQLLVNLALASLLVGCASGPPASPALSAAAPTSSPAGAMATPTQAPTAAPAATRPPGPMSSGRSTHTATSLADGRVLLAGGYDFASPITSADLFDPRTDAFTATGQMATARGFDTATLLLDGRVLFAGGNPFTWTFPGPFIASAELYDPTTGTFGPTGSLATARNLHTATLLTDGRVLITGGNDTYGHSLASAELYDPKTGTFSPTGSMTTPRGFHSAARLPDGRVLIAGGGSAGWTGGHFVASAEVYDPATGTFTATGPMTVDRALHATTLLADGRVLVAGGFNNDNGGSKSLASAEVYDPESGTFAATGSMADERTFDAAVLLTDGRVLITGGVRNGWDYANLLDSAEIYDPGTGTFTTIGPMSGMRVSPTATLLPDGRVLIAGGYNGSVDDDSAEVYDPTSDMFTLIGPGG